jgi:hypothetical protein
MELQFINRLPRCRIQRFFSKFSLGYKFSGGLTGPKAWHQRVYLGRDRASPPRFPQPTPVASREAGTRDAMAQFLVFSYG